MQPTKAKTAGVTVATTVAVDVAYDPTAPNDGIVITIPDPVYQTGAEGDVCLGPGQWVLEFKLINSPGCEFSDGPILIGRDDPGSTEPYPTSFVITETGKTQVNVSFTIAAGNLETYRYAIRVRDPQGNNHIHDPKIINRGCPAPLKATPPKVPPLEY